MDDEVGERIRVTRIARGMSQAELAAAVGVSNSYLSHIEAGRRPASKEFRRQIAATLGVEASELEEGVPSDKKEEIRLKLSFAELALRNGDWQLAEDTYSQVLRTARAMPFNRFVDEATWGMARALEATGQVERAIESYEGLVGQGSLSPAVPRWAVTVALIRAYSECGDLARAIDIGERALGESETAGTEEVGSQVEVISTLAGCYLERGDLTRASLLIERALRVAEQDGALRSRAAAAWNAAVIEDARHDTQAASLHAARALAMYEELDNQRAIGLLRVVAAGLFLRQERPKPEAALPLLDRALTELSTSGTELDVEYVHTEQARAHLLAGRPDQAFEIATAALTALPDEERIQRGRMLLVLGHAERAQGHSEDALVTFLAAAEQLNQAGAQRQAATAWRELGEAYVELGRPAEAIEALRQASDLAGARYSFAVLDTASRQSVSH